MEDSDDYFEFDDKKHYFTDTNNEELLDQDHEFLFQKKPHFSMNFFFKDVEISYRAFLLFFLVFNALIILEISQVILFQNIISKTGKDFNIYLFIIAGIFFGFLLGIPLIDRIKKPLNFTFMVLITQFSSILIQGVMNQLKIYNLLLNGLFFISSLFFIMGIIIFFKIFLLKTSFLERGRIGAYVFFFIVVLSFISLLVIYIPILFFIPFGIVVTSIIYTFISIRKKNITVYRLKEQKIQTKFPEFIKFYFFIGFFSLTAGFTSPFGGTSEVIFEFFLSNTPILILTVSLLLIVSSLILGLTFDYLGRIGALSFIVFAVALANYLTCLQSGIFGITESVVVVVYISSYIIIPLYIGDIATKYSYGKYIAISTLIHSAGLLVGMAIKQYINVLYSSGEYANNVITSTSFMASIVCLLFLVYMRETLPSKEQDWKNQLLHLYIIHESGMLIQEFSFHDKFESREAEIISGGIVGLVSMLKEIVKGEKEIKTIDHEDRKIMFKLNRTKEIIFALLVQEELYVFRNKLEKLAQDFDRECLDRIREINQKGIDTEDFLDVKYIVRKHFGY